MPPKKQTPKAMVAFAKAKAKALAKIENEKKKIKLEEEKLEKQESSLLSILRESEEMTAKFQHGRGYLNILLEKEYDKIEVEIDYLTKKNQFVEKLLNAPADVKYNLQGYDILREINDFVGEGIKTPYGKYKRGSDQYRAYLETYYDEIYKPYYEPLAVLYKKANMKILPLEKFLSDRLVIAYIGKFYQEEGGSPLLDLETYKAIKQMPPLNFTQLSPADLGFGFGEIDVDVDKFNIQKKLDDDVLNYAKLSIHLNDMLNMKDKHLSKIAQENKAEYQIKKKELSNAETINKKADDEIVPFETIEQLKADLVLLDNVPRHHTSLMSYSMRAKSLVDMVKNADDDIKILISHFDLPNEERLLEIFKTHETIHNVILTETKRDEIRNDSKKRQQNPFYSETDPDVPEPSAVTGLYRHPAEAEELNFSIDKQIEEIQRDIKATTATIQVLEQVPEEDIENRPLEKKTLESSRAELLQLEERLGFLKDKQNREAGDIEKIQDIKEITDKIENLRGRISVEGENDPDLKKRLLKEIDKLKKERDKIVTEIYGAGDEGDEDLFATPTHAPQPPPQSPPSPIFVISDDPPPPPSSVVLPAGVISVPADVEVVNIGTPAAGPDGDIDILGEALSHMVGTTAGTVGDVQSQDFGQADDPISIYFKLENPTFYKKIKIFDPYNFAMNPSEKMDLYLKNKFII